MIRILVADDHAVVREGIRALLASEDDVDVVGQAGHGDEVIGLVDRLDPDVVVLELVMPGRRGLDLIGDLARRSGELVPVVVEVEVAVPRSRPACW